MLASDHPAEFKLAFFRYIPAPANFVSGMFLNSLNIRSEIRQRSLDPLNLVHKTADLSHCVISFSKSVSRQLNFNSFCDRSATFFRYTQIYFVIWWLVAAVVCINLFIALVIEVRMSSRVAQDKLIVNEVAVSVIPPILTMVFVTHTSSRTSTGLTANRVYKPNQL